MDQALTLRLQILDGVAKNLPLDLLHDPERFATNLHHRPTVRTLFDDLVLVSPNGTLLAEFPVRGRRGTPFADPTLVQHTVHTREPAISRPVVGTAGYPTVAMSAPIVTAHGDLVALFIGTVSLLQPSFLGSLAEARVGKTGSFALFTLDRLIVLSRDKARIMTSGPAPGVSPYFDRAMRLEEGWEENTNSRGLQALFTYKRLQTVPWVLTAALPVAEAYAPIRTAQHRIMGITVLLAVLHIPAIWWGVHYLLAPLLTLHATIRAIRADPTTAQDAEVTTQDEIGMLAADFNTLMHARRQAEHALQVSEQRLRTITDNVPALIAYVGADQRYQFVNQAFAAWFASGREAIVGCTAHEILGEHAYQCAHPYIAAALRGEHIRYERTTVKGTTENVWQVTYVPEWDAHQQVRGFFALLTDITDTKQHAAQLEALALSDALTGLPNRRLLKDRIGQAIAHARRHDTVMAVLFLDLDGFKTINDTLGHDMGDLLLQQVAQRLVGAVRAEDTIARLGGDEFVICLARLTAPEDAGVVAAKLIRTVAYPYALQGQEGHVTVSIGIALYPQSGDTDAALMHAADAALYAAKHAGKNVYRWAPPLLGEVA